MIYRIKEKFWSWGNEFAITDPDENLRFMVKGAAFSWGDKLSFEDAAGNQIAFIEQRLWSWKPQYEISIGGELFAEVVKEFSWFDRKFTLDVPGPNDYVIEGSFWAHDFEFLRGGRVVAVVNKKAWSWTDSYGVEIVDGENDIAVLCTCIVIDQVLHDGDGGGVTD